MIADHDKSEWANVSSGTGSPGLSRTKSRELLNGCCVVVDAAVAAFRLRTLFTG